MNVGLVWSSVVAISQGYWARSGVMWQAVAAAVQALATLVLVLVTMRYVHLTKDIATRENEAVKAAQEQVCLESTGGGDPSSERFAGHAGPSGAPAR